MGDREQTGAAATCQPQTQMDSQITFEQHSHLGDHLVFDTIALAFARADTCSSWTHAASPSSSAPFNPPKAPRAFMSPPGGSAPPLSLATASSSANTSAAAPASTAATAPSAPSATATPSPVTSTPARIGIAGVAAGLGHTPSSASSASSTGSTRYPAPGLTSPTPATNALPGNAAGSYHRPATTPRTKGPASMRDGDPRADAWAEAREAREAPKPMLAEAGEPTTTAPASATPRRQRRP